MGKSLKITALAITLNEGKIIESFVKSPWFVDEIIIIDYASADDTVSLASKDEKLTIYQQIFNKFFNQNNFAISKAKNDWIVRVLNKKRCKYDWDLVHEMLKTKGETSKLKKKLPHHAHKSLVNHTFKLHGYSALQAQIICDKKKKPSLVAFLLRHFNCFWNQYIVRPGILDGKEGFILANINPFSVCKRDTNLCMLYRKID